MRRIVAGWMLMSILMGIGCGRSSDADRPPALRYGEEACAQCRMLISEARFAAAAIDSQGHARFFDGLSCWVRYQRRHHEAWRRAWAHDYETGQWLEAQAAWFVQCPSCFSPMGDQVIAVATPEQATRLAGASGAAGVRSAEVSSLVAGD